MKSKFALTSAIVIAATAFGAEATAPASTEEWMAAVMALKKEVPEFAEFCSAFGAAQIRTIQNDKRVPVITIVLQGAISERYLAVFIYEVSYISKFTKVSKIVSENLGINRVSTLESMKQGQALRPLALTRSDLPKIAAEGAAYLDRRFGK